MTFLGVETKAPTRCAKSTADHVTVRYRDVTFREAVNIEYAPARHRLRRPSLVSVRFEMLRCLDNAKMSDGRTHRDRFSHLPQRHAAGLRRPGASAVPRTEGARFARRPSVRDAIGPIDICFHRLGSDSKPSREPRAASRAPTRAQVLAPPAAVRGRVKWMHRMLPPWPEASATPAPRPSRTALAREP